MIKANVPKTALGALYIVAVVDDLGTITESNETNNTTSYKINVVSPPDIDLVFNTLSTPMNVPGAGSTLSLKWTVQNTGVDAAGAFTVKISYGDSVQQTNLVVLAEVSLSGLSGGSTSAVQTTSITLPPSVRYGSRVLHLEVDAKQAVVETNEANNVETRALSIDGKPDLYVSRMGLSLTPLGPGQKAIVSYQIKNQGKSQANGSFEVKIYESATQTITSASTLLRTFSLTDLDANRSVPLTGTTTFAMNAPANAPSGRRWIVAVVDTKSTITESNESNNTRVLSYTYQSPNTEPVSEPRSESVIDAGSREFVQEKSFFESAKEPMKEPVKEAIVESVVEPSTELKSEPARDGSEPMVPDIHSVDVVIRDIVTGEKVNELDAGSTEVVVPNQGCGCSGGDSSSFPTLMLLVLLLIGFRKRQLLSN